MTNRERFAALYATKLTAAIAAHPDRYGRYGMYYASTVIRPNVGPTVTIPVASVGLTVERMTAALMRGNVSLKGNPVIAATLKALGVPVNITSARAYLAEAEPHA